MNEIPVMIRLLVESNLITQVDVQELLAKLEKSPDKTVSDVLLESGTVTQPQLKSLQLAESLLNARNA